MNSLTRFYLVALLLCGAATALILQAGSRLSGSGLAAGFGTGAAHAAGAASPLASLLLAVAVTMAAAQLMGALCRRLGQPPVMGEVVAGIALGPTLLGALWPTGAEMLFPASVLPGLNAAAQLGVILYVFAVGVELDEQELKSHGSSTAVISHASILLPFTLGCLLALGLYPLYGPSDVPFHVFALFLGASMSVTAFPVLARILTDAGLQGTYLGGLALSCAAVDDVSAWCLLAAVTGVASGAGAAVASTLGWGLLLLVLLLTVVRPVVRRLAAFCEGQPEREGTALAALLGLALLCAWSTEKAGLHALFGAFSLGVVTPAGSRLAQRAGRDTRGLVSAVLLPCFFAITGLKTRLGLVSGALGWGVVALTVLVASVGKFGGTYLSSRWCGLPHRSAAALGLLMNTRGLMELIVLTLGLELHILTPSLYAVFVLMALITTFATQPLLRWIQPAHEEGKQALWGPQRAGVAAPDHPTTLAG